MARTVALVVVDSGAVDAASVPAGVKALMRWLIRSHA